MIALSGVRSSWFTLARKSRLVAIGGLKLLIELPELIVHPVEVSR